MKEIQLSPPQRLVYTKTDMIRYIRIPVAVIIDRSRMRINVCSVESPNLTKWNLTRYIDTTITYGFSILASPRWIVDSITLEFR